MRATPPLLQLIEGRRVRPRRAPRIVPREIELQKQVADLLRRHCLPTWRWTHIPSGELRDIRVAAKLKAMGVQRGWPDILMLAPGGNAHGLELKRQGEGLTEDQEAFQLWAIKADTTYSVASSIAEVHVILDRWGCCRIRLVEGAP